MLRLASLTSALLLLGCANQGDEGMTVINNTTAASGVINVTSSAVSSE